MNEPTWESLRTFTKQRLALEGANYCGAPQAYRADRNRIVRDRADALNLIRWAEAWGVDPATVPASRLSFGANGWDYCPGQYYQVELCRAVCRAVADSIETHHAEKSSRPRSVERQSICDYIAAAGGPGSRRLARWFK